MHEAAKTPAKEFNHFDHGTTTNGGVVESQNGDKKLRETRNGAPMPLDGGWGWVVVFCSTVVTTIVGGSYSAFSMCYVELSEAFGTSKAATGWIGSIYMATGHLLGIFFSVAVREYGCRAVCVSGALVTCLGYIASSFATSVVFLYLSFGLLAGAGVGMIVLSTVVVVLQYFDKRRALAAGVAASGFSVGALSGAPVMHALMRAYSWRGALLIFSAIFLQVVACGLLYRPLTGAPGGHRRRPIRKKEEIAADNIRPIIDEGSNGVDPILKVIEAGDSTEEIGERDIGNAEEFQPIVDKRTSQIVPVEQIDNIYSCSYYLATLDKDTADLSSKVCTNDNNCKQSNFDENNCASSIDAVELCSLRNNDANESDSKLQHSRNGYTSQTGEINIPTSCKNANNANAKIGAEINSSHADVRASGCGSSGCGMRCEGVLVQLCAAFDFSLLYDLPFCLYLLAQFLGHFGLVTFYQHTPSRAVHLDVERHLVSLLPLVSGVATGVSRVLLSFVANAPCTDRLLQFAVALTASAAVQCTTFLARDFATLALYGALQGVLIGAVFCVMNTVLVDLKGIENVARAQSMLALALGSSLLLAIPFSGYLFDVTRNYDLPFLVTGCMQLCGGLSGLAVVVIRRYRARRLASAAILKGENQTALKF